MNNNCYTCPLGFRVRTKVYVMQPITFVFHLMKAHTRHYLCIHTHYSYSAHLALCRYLRDIPALLKTTQHPKLSAVDPKPAEAVV